MILLHSPIWMIDLLKDKILLINYNIMNTLREKKLIFLIEDNADFAKVVKTGLENQPDYTVMHFGTGEEMLDYLTKNPTIRPEIFILDYELASVIANAKNGEEILKELVVRYKQKNLLEELKVIILTGSGDIKIAIKLLKRGATDFILKSEDDFFESVKDTVRKIFDVKKLKADQKYYKDKAADYKKRLIFVSIALTLAIIGILIYAVVGK